MGLCGKKSAYAIVRGLKNRSLMLYEYFPNVVFLANPKDDPRDLMDYTACVSCVEFFKEMHEEWFAETFFLFTWVKNESAIKDVNTKQYNRKILLWLAEEERGFLPIGLSDYTVIFKNHLREQPSGNKILPLPLFTPLDSLPSKDVPFKERELNLFFSGNLNINRLDLYYQLNDNKSWLEKLIYKVRRIRGGFRLFTYYYKDKTFDFSNLFEKSFVRFNNGFHSGLSPEEYAAKTSHSKIVLSPKGFYTSECFRLYEAMHAGCIVITEILPQLSFYKDIPVVQVDSWKDVQKLVNNLLADESKLENISDNAVEFYEEHLSVRAISEYVYKYSNGPV